MVRAEKEKIIVLLCERHETREHEISRVSRAVTTLGAGDFSSAVSGFCQVFVVTRFAARGFDLRPKTCRPSANTETSRRTREKPLVPRVCSDGKEIYKN